MGVKVDFVFLFNDGGGVVEVNVGDVSEERC